jgi:hypothetical protein
MTAQKKARLGRYVISRLDGVARKFELRYVSHQENRLIAIFDSFVAAFDFAAELYWGTR